MPVAGVEVPTFYHRNGEVGVALGDEFTLDAAVGIGVMVPPPYLEARWQRVPALIRRFKVGFADGRLRRMLPEDAGHEFARALRGLGSPSVAQIFDRCPQEPRSKTWATL